uniref:DUF4218 domain-containing protein n=1 Tax=Lactuca sativa TaxID=4236 RepID=A0A9R1UY78_LACSA|nr:hypothetical protein LSAT_V11C700384740 [Lactuca sativa]
MRHNIDVMHVIKNVGENFLGTLLNIEKRTKDTDLARRDLQDMKIGKNLHLVKKNDRWIKPPAPYVLTPIERKQFCSLVKSVRFPDGYAANLGKNVIVEQIMMHLCVHLPQEAILGGPVQSRWMYPVERYLGHLKKYVRNTARPEGSIAEGYVVEEALIFCSHYLRGVDSILDKRGTYDDETTSDVRDYKLDIFRLNGRGIGKRETVRISNISIKKALWFMLTNCSQVEPYLNKHLNFLERQHQAALDFSELQQSTFPSWFSSRIGTMYEQNSSKINEVLLYALSRGPDNRVISHSGYIVNGVKFLVKSRDDHRRTQNCGVTAVGIHNGVEEDYYGYVDEVLEFSFIKGYRVILFKSIWFNTDRKRKHVMFEPHFISIDTTKKAYDEDPFVLANQAKQVFYINDPTRDSGWKIIERSTHRQLWDITDNEDVQDMFEHVGTSSDTTPFQTSNCENFEFHVENGEEEFVEIVDVEAFEDNLDDFIDYDTIPKEISEEPEDLEGLDDSNETNVALFDDSDDKYE